MLVYYFWLNPKNLNLVYARVIRLLFFYVPLITTGFLGELILGGPVLVEFLP